jgi:acetyl esterase/lipase
MIQITDDLYPPLTDNSLTLKAIAVSNSTEQSEIAAVRYVIDKVDCSFGISYDLPTVTPNKHILDIYQPKNSENTPVLIFIHGGAWKQGDKNMYMELGNTFAGYYNLTTVVNQLPIICSSLQCCSPNTHP